jgi:hypothetical protein
MYIFVFMYMDIYMFIFFLLFMYMIMYMSLFLYMNNVTKSSCTHHCKKYVLYCSFFVTNFYVVPVFLSEFCVVFPRIQQYRGIFYTEFGRISRNSAEV